MEQMFAFFPYLLLFAFFGSSDAPVPSGTSEQSASRDRAVDGKTALKMALLITGIVSLTLYLVLFTTLDPMHDATHHFRHSLAIVPCH